jgi:hypothetical protein
MMTLCVIIYHCFINDIERAVSENELLISSENEFSSAGIQDVFVSGGDSQESSFLMIEGHKRPSIIRNIAHNIKS